jgi:hypothetical protein
MVTNTETSEPRPNPICHLEVEIPDMNLELFDHLFTSRIEDRRFSVPPEPPYVLLERRQPDRFSSRYILLRQSTSDDIGDEDGSDEDRGGLDLITMYAMQSKLTTLWILLEERHGVMQLWIEETFRVAMQPVARSQTISRRVHAAQKRMNRPGHPGVKAHATAIERLNHGEPEHLVRAEWRTQYKEETGTAPDDRDSGEDELWRKGVRDKWQRPTNK